MQTNIDYSRSAHAVAFTACLHHAARLAGLFLLNLLVRGAAFFPLILTLAGGNVFRFPSAHAIPLSLVACIPLYALIVMPFRFFTHSTLTWVTGWRETAPVFTARNLLLWLAAGLLRLLRALPFLLPMITLTIAFYVYSMMTGFNEFALIIKDIGALIGGDYAHGIALIALAFMLFLALAIWGWRRDLPLTYQAVDLEGIRASLANARRVRKRRFSGLARTTWINFLIIMPALAAVVYFVQDYLRSLMTGDLPMDLLNTLVMLTTLAFPEDVYLRIGIATLILYLPAVLWRKAALAVTIGRAGTMARDR